MRDRLWRRITGDPRLGVWSDTALARALRCNTNTVIQVRQSLSIPKSGARMRASAAQHVAVAGHPKLGKVVDRVIAEEIGVSKRVVCHVREALGIPSCREAWGAFSAPVSAGGDLCLSPTEQAVVELLRERGPMRRARVRAAVALTHKVTRETASNAIRRLLRDGLVLETDDHVLSLAEGT